MPGSLRTWYSLPDLDRFAAREAELAGEVELKRLSRLRDMLHADDGSVAVGLRFEPARAGWLPMRLEYEVSLRLVCQRCLEPMDWVLAAEAKLGLIESAAAESLLPDDYEAVLLEGARFNPSELLEDELLMALPLVPKHDDVGDCGALALDRIDHEGNVRTTKPAFPDSH